MARGVRADDDDVWTRDVRRGTPWRGVGSRGVPTARTIATRPSSCRARRSRSAQMTTCHCAPRIRMGTALPRSTSCIATSAWVSSRARTRRWGQSSRRVGQDHMAWPSRRNIPFDDAGRCNRERDAGIGRHDHPQRQNAGRIRAMERKSSPMSGSRRRCRSRPRRRSSARRSLARRPGRPPRTQPWRVQASTGVRGAWTHATAAFEWRFIGQFDDDRNTPSFELDRRRGGRSGGAWRKRRAELFALENAFDAEQEVEVTPPLTIGLPRTFRAGVRWHR